MTSEERSLLIGRAVDVIQAVLVDLLPAGPGDERPPDEWPHWQNAHRLMEARLQLRYFLNDPPK